MQINMKVLIAGSRNITAYSELAKAITAAIEQKIIGPCTEVEIVEGGSRGVDTLAKQYAQQYGYKLTEMKPEYKGNWDKSAPIRRNCDMGDYADVLVAVWDGVSSGTKHMITYITSLNKPVYVHIVK